MDEELKLPIRPLHLQLADVLRSEIAGGAWKFGTFIPIEAELSREFGVGLATVCRAIEELERESIVRREGGSRWLVCQVN